VSRPEAIVPPQEIKLEGGTLHDGNKQPSQQSQAKDTHKYVEPGGKK
jgi:hypothetical protein